jgi:hypothetical protein
MPAIESIPVPTYTALSPVHHTVDNQPIFGLIERIDLVNSQVDNNTIILNSAIGTQGTLANRLAQSIDEDGSLKTIAINNALHSIANHTDDGGFVRMTLDERTKLSFIASEATSLAINISTISGIIPYVNTTLDLAPSDSIVWRYDGVRISPDMNLPASIRHVHHYGLVPVTSDRQNYVTTSLSTAYMSGSLRVYINGVRLNSDGIVYVPFGQPSTVTWTAVTYTEGTASDGIVTGGNFELSTVISASAKIVIDFDVSFS